MKGARRWRWFRKEAARAVSSSSYRCRDPRSRSVTAYASIAMYMST